MEDGEPADKSNDTGKKPDTISKKDESNDKPDESNLSIVEEAKKVRDEIKAENDRREVILEKEQKLQTEKMLGGQTEAGTEVKKEFSDEEKASRARIKAVADTSGSAWGKDYA